MDKDWVNTVRIYEFKSALNAFLSHLSNEAAVHSLKEVIAFNESIPDLASKYGQAILEESDRTSGTLTEAKYILARAEDLKVSREMGIDLAISEYQLDALLFPESLGAAIAAKAGYPSVTVPSGYTSDGLPFGITFTGMAYSEPTLIKLAFAYEQTTMVRVPPRLD